MSEKKLLGLYVCGTKNVGVVHAYVVTLVKTDAAQYKITTKSIYYGDDKKPLWRNPIIGEVITCRFDCTAYDIYKDQKHIQQSCGDGNVIADMLIPKEKHC